MWPRSVSVCHTSEPADLLQVVWSLARNQSKEEKTKSAPKHFTSCRKKTKKQNRPTFSWEIFEGGQWWWRRAMVVGAKSHRGAWNHWKVFVCFPLSVLKRRHEAYQDGVSDSFGIFCWDFFLHFAKAVLQETVEIMSEKPLEYEDATPVGLKKHVIAIGQCSRFKFPAVKRRPKQQITDASASKARGHWYSEDGVVEEWHEYMIIIYIYIFRWMMALQSVECSGSVGVVVVTVSPFFKWQRERV